MKPAAHDERHPFRNAHPADLRGAVSGVEEGEGHPQRCRALEGNDPIGERAFARAVGARQDRPVGHEGGEAPGFELGTKVVLVLNRVHEGPCRSRGHAPEHECPPRDCRKFTAQQVGGPVTEDAASRRRQTHFHPGFDETRAAGIAGNPDRGAFEDLLAARVDPDLPAVAGPRRASRTGNRPAEFPSQEVGEGGPASPVGSECSGKAGRFPVHLDPDAGGRGEGIAGHPVHEHGDAVPEGPLPLEIPVGRVAASVQPAAGAGQVGAPAQGFPLLAATREGAGAVRRDGMPPVPCGWNRS